MVSVRFLAGKKYKSALSDIPFERIKNGVLGGGYDLSLVCIGDRRSQTLNATYRGKDAPANVLAFPISETEGEIFLNPVRALREARSVRMDATPYFGYLFIHGILHLKGYEHGDTMEKEEDTLFNTYITPIVRPSRPKYGSKHLNRHRHRNLPG